MYRPDFIVHVDDGRGNEDLLHLVVEIKGYRREDAKEKKSTMETYWVPGVNSLGTYGRWAFAELTEIYTIASDFQDKVEEAFDRLMVSLVSDFSGTGPATVERVAAYVATQLGSNQKWQTLSRAIWTELHSPPDHSFELSNVSALSDATASEPTEILAILSLLSADPLRLVRMEFASMREGGADVPFATFVQTLTKWWRDGELTDDAWHQWASGISVKWILDGSREPRV